MPVCTGTFLVMIIVEKFAVNENKLSRNLGEVLDCFNSTSEKI
jgi:hypothetical protein